MGSESDVGLVEILAIFIALFSRVYIYCSLHSFFLAFQGGRELTWRDGPDGLVVLCMIGLDYIRLTADT